jgi:hypothetical protein
MPSALSASLVARTASSAWPSEGSFSSRAARNPFGYQLWSAAAGAA